MPSAIALYEDGLTSAASGPGRASAYRMRSADGTLHPLALRRWLSGPTSEEWALLQNIAGPVLDVGCGPGRHVAELRRRGVVTLGIDISPAAISLARRQGAPATLGCVFGPVPRAGSWGTILLLDGNIGIGGDPQALLHRVTELLRPGGGAWVELAPPGIASGPRRMRLEHAGHASDWFRWALVGVDDVDELSAASGAVVSERRDGGGRHFARIETAGS